MGQDTKAVSRSHRPPGDGGPVTHLVLDDSPMPMMRLHGYRREWPLTASGITDAGDASTTPKSGSTTKQGCYTTGIRNADPEKLRAAMEAISRDLSPYWKARLDYENGAT